MDAKKQNFTNTELKIRKYTLPIGRFMRKHHVCYKLQSIAEMLWWLVKQLVKGLKITIIYLFKGLSVLFFGAAFSVKDQFFSKHQKHSTKENVTRFLVNATILVAAAMLFVHLSVKTTQVVHAALNPTLTKQQQNEVNEHIASLKADKNTTTKFSNEILPDGQKMPQGVHYIWVSPLDNSPLTNGTIKSNVYKNGKIKIVDKLFVNPVNDDQRFMNNLAQAAQIAAISYGTNPSVLIAQAYLESGAGQSQLAAKYNNYFGIKYRGTGDSVTLPTQEDDGKGNLYTINSAFQVYPSLKEAMRGNAELLRYGIKGNPTRYAGTWVENTSSYKDATNALTGNYATDTTYNTKLNKLIETYGLYALDVHKI